MQNNNTAGDGEPNTKKRPDDIRFLLNTFSLTLMVVAILVTFQPYLENDQMLVPMKQVEQHIELVSPEDLPRLLQSPEKQTVMLVGYASWCPYCRQLMPMLVDMMRNHELDGVKPVFVSLDDIQRSLSRYLVHNEYIDVMHAPYYLMGRNLSYRVEKALDTTGSRFTGAIPYVGFFRDGKIKTDAVGTISQRQLKMMVKAIKQEE